MATKKTFENNLFSSLNMNYSVITNSSVSNRGNRTQYHDWVKRMDKKIGRYTVDQMTIKANS